MRSWFPLRLNTSREAPWPQRVPSAPRRNDKPAGARLGILRSEATKDLRPGRRKTLDRILSRAGVASRTEARQWIAAGRVSVDGAVARDPDRWVDPDREAVLVDGKPLQRGAHTYIVLHKPVGCVTTRRDPEGRPTVFDLLENQGTLIAAGRLDRETSGLLILTDDTDFAARITDPDFHVPKTYVVKAKSFLDDQQLGQLRDGVVLSDGVTRSAEIRRLRNPGGKTVLEIVITEGRNRQVRRMIEAVGSKVKSLARVAIGPVQLAGLPAGRWRALNADEVAALLDAAKPSRRRRGRGTRRRRAGTGDRGSPKK